MTSPPTERRTCPYCQSRVAVARYCAECGFEMDKHAWLAREEPEVVDEPESWFVQRRAVIAVGAAVLLVPLVAIGIVLLTRGGDAPEQRADRPPPAANIPPPPPKPAPANSPTGVIRAHWRAIGRRDYDGAYDLLSAEYRGRVSKTDWVGAHERDAPRVYVRRVAFVKSLPGSEASVFADVYTRDTGSRGDSSACIRFAGRVRVVGRGGRWRYRPGAAGDTFERRPVGSRSDPGCRRLFD